MLFFAAETQIPFKKTHFPTQKLPQKRVFSKGIGLSDAKNPKIFPPAAGLPTLRNSQKVASNANFWTHPPPPGGVWVKQRREKSPNFAKLRCFAAVREPLPPPPRYRHTALLTFLTPNASLFFWIPDQMHLY